MAVIIFDYDGTLHDSMRIYAPAVRNCHERLVKAGIMKRREISEEELKSYLGLTGPEMWELFAPELSQEQRQEGRRIIGEELSKRVCAHEAHLYKGSREMLEQLKAQGHHLVYLSNCRESYMNLHAEEFHLRNYFDEMLCAGQFGGKAKFEIVKELLPAWGGSAIAVGDRYKDMEISQVGNVKTIWCAYGYGSIEEGQSADAIAESVTEIPKLVKQLLG